MADINVDIVNLREAAARHAETSDYLRTMPASHQAIQDSLDSLGPIFADLREAGRELLEQRRLCYQQQADDHADMAHNLQVAALHWEEHDAAGASKIRAVLDDH